MPMTRSTQRNVGLAIAAAAAIVALACIVALIGDMIAARRQAPLDEQRLEELLESVKTDAAAAAELDAEHQRQADESLRRETKTARAAWVLIIAAALFLAAVKWLVSLRAQRPPTLNTIVALRAPPPTRPRKAGGDVRWRPAAGPQVSELGEQEIDTSFVDAIVAKEGCAHEAAVPILQAIQAHYGYLPDEALQRVCELTEIEPSQIAGVSAFYARFRRSPVGEHVVKVCHGTACHVAGTRQITEEIRRHLQIAPEADTDPERLFTVDRVACLGCCSLAPVMMIDEETVGRLTPSSACEALDAAGQERSV